MLDKNPESEYIIVNYNVGPTRTGVPMGKLQVRSLETNEVTNCVLWEKSLNKLKSNNVHLKCGNIIKILKADPFDKTYNNCRVEEIEVTKEAKSGLSDEEIEDKYNVLTEYIKKIENPDLMTFVKNLIDTKKDDFKTKPAAKAMHHNYYGGLLEHTVECLDILETVLNVAYQNVNRDNAIAAVVLHDYGKIFEYKMDNATGEIEYVENFRKDWISHSQYGFTICMSEYMKTGNECYKEVAKMIAAHHGRIEWGALIDLDQKDLGPEYYLVHHIDDLSAKFGKITVNDLD